MALVRLVMGCWAPALCWCSGYKIRCQSRGSRPVWHSPKEVSLLLSLLQLLFLSPHFPSESQFPSWASVFLWDPSLPLGANSQSRTLSLTLGPPPPHPHLSSWLRVRSEWWSCRRSPSPSPPLMTSMTTPASPPLTCTFSRTWAPAWSTWACWSRTTAALRPHSLLPHLPLPHRPSCTFTITPRRRTTSTSVHPADTTRRATVSSGPARPASGRRQTRTDGRRRRCVSGGG